MTTTPAITGATPLDRVALGHLSRSLSLPPLLAGDPSLPDEVAAFNAAVSHRPDVVVRAACADDVVAAVRFAVDQGLPVGVQGTGHGAYESANGGVLITTQRLQEVSVDPAECTARVGAGVKWLRVIEAAAPYGLAPMSGSSSDVGVVGYTLGGGLGPLGRAHGFSADHVRAIELVTGDGVWRRVTAESDPDLFWGLRGGKGNLGIVTAIEVELLPVSHLYAGHLVFAGSHARAVLGAWQSWTRALPEQMSTSIALMRLPDLPHVPPPLRGTLSLHLRVAYSGDPVVGERLVAPLRAAAPALADTVRVLPFTETDSIHMDPTNPAPAWVSGAGLRGLPDEVLDVMLGLLGPQADSPLVMVELRLLGGALARPAAVPNAVAGRSAAYSVFVLGADVPVLGEAVRRAGRTLLNALLPWQTDERLVNFAGTADPQAVARLWDPVTSARLSDLVATYDPRGLFVRGHALPRHSTADRSAA